MKTLVKFWNGPAGKTTLLSLTLALGVVVFNMLISSRYAKSVFPDTGDAREYHEVAKAIMAGSSQAQLPGGTADIGFNSAPGFAFLLSFVYKLFGIETINVFVMHVMAQIAVVLMLFFILAAVTRRVFAYWFALWLTAFLPLWKYNFLILTEISTVFFLVLATLFFFLYLRTAKTWLMILFTLAFGVLVFINNRFVFHFACLAALMFILIIKKSGFRWKDLGIFILGVVLVLLPWHIRQMRVYGRPVLFSPKRTSAMIPDDIETELNHSRMVEVNYSSERIMSYEEYLQDLDQREGWSPSRIERAKDEFSSKKYDELRSRHDWIKSRGYYKYISRLLEFWRIWRFDFSLGPGDDPRIIPPSRPLINLINILYLLPMFLFFPVGLIFSIRKREAIMVVAGSIVLMHWLLHALVHYIERYRVPVLPLLFLVSWYGLHYLITGCLNKRKGSAPA